MLEEHIGYMEDGFFVEVGAFDGINWSPCRTLALAGWDGIFFEPQSIMYLKLLGNYKTVAGITCVKKAISDHVGLENLYLGGSISTIKKDAKELYLDIPGFRSTGLASDKREEVQVATLDIELERLGAPPGFEVLIIDVEGSEMDVLNGFTIREWLPELVVIEAYEKFRDKRLSTKAVGINEYMDRAGYTKIYSDRINNVYVREQRAVEGVHGD